jgi:putative ABC transport system substrate-binding protein
MLRRRPSAAHGLTHFFGNREIVEAGGLLSYSTDFNTVYRRAAEYVDTILKGARPGDLPIEQPSRFQVAVNLKTAKLLGIAIPQSLLARADEVIQ